MFKELSMMKHKKIDKHYQNIEKYLNENLFDQQEAVSQLIKILIQSDYIQAHLNVKALFTFIGPSNSGKRYLAKLLQLSDTDIKAIKSFNMNQYNSNYLLGLESSDIPYIENEIVSFVKENPKSILVFEDIEKADLQIQLSLYHLFNDEEKNEVDFSGLIVIMTTTLLGSLIQRNDLREMFVSDPMQAHTFLMERLGRESILVNGVKEEAYSKKLLSLLNEHTLIPFRRLSLDTLIKIGARSINKLSYEFNQTSGIVIEYTDFDKFISLLIVSLAPYLNARHIIKKVPELLFSQIYDAMRMRSDIERICFEISEMAIEFVNEIFQEQQLFTKKTSKQHYRIQLKWELSHTQKSVTCKMKNASYVKEKLLFASDDTLHFSEIKFSDVAGQQRVKNELLEVKALLKEPRRLQNFGMTPPKGMFLYGQKGMGKKLLAKAFANECDMPYITISGAELFDASKIKRAYAQAYISAPAIVILEDIDINGVINGVLSKMDLTPLVDELDNITQSFEAPVFTIITLSSSMEIPEDLNKAGRIDIRIEVPKLDIEARRFFINEVLKKPHDGKIDVERVIRYISGLGGNELKRIGEEAALQCARKGITQLTEEILLEQINIIKYGTKLENKQIRDIEASMAKTAYHEAGHAVLSYFLLPKIKIEQVTVAPRSEALGFVSYHNEDYIDATSKEELFNDICVLLAGRIADMEQFGESGLETGAINDLEVANMQAYAAIALFGMDEELGYINTSGIDSVYDKSILDKRIEERLLVWMNRAREKTISEVKRVWPAIEAVAKELIAKEMIDGEELKSIITRAYKE
jgi:ATP-dependent Zn protease